MPKISIIIKSYNEENHIEASIRSALDALKDCGGEVILVDSLSDDQTIRIAKKFQNIRIFQIRNKKDRSRGLAQIGYLNAKYDFLLALDGDMILEKDFISKSFELLRRKNAIGVGGQIIEKNYNMIYARNQMKFLNSNQYVDFLIGGGLFKKESIDQLGFFYNIFLHSGEEIDLGCRLKAKNKRLFKSDCVFAHHYGKTSGTINYFLDRILSRYIFGSGEVLRYNLLKKGSSIAIKFYLALIVYMSISVISLLLILIHPGLFKYILLIFLAGVVTLMIRKRSLIDAVFSATNVIIYSIGLLLGLFSKKKDPFSMVNYVEIVPEIHK